MVVGLLHPAQVDTTRKLVPIFPSSGAQTPALNLAAGFDNSSFTLAHCFLQAESMSTLVFASRCMRVRNAPVRHEECDQTEETLR